MYTVKHMPCIRTVISLPSDSRASGRVTINLRSMVTKPVEIHGQQRERSHSSGMSCWTWEVPATRRKASSADSFFGSLNSHSRGPAGVISCGQEFLRIFFRTSTYVGWAPRIAGPWKVWLKSMQPSGQTTPLRLLLSLSADPG